MSLTVIYRNSRRYGGHIETRSGVSVDGLEVNPLRMGVVWALCELLRVDYEYTASILGEEASCASELERSAVQSRCTVRVLCTVH